MKEMVEDGVMESLEHWYQYIFDTIPMETTRALKIKNVSNLIQLVISDLKTGCSQCQVLFQEIMDIDYLQLAFIVYQKEVSFQIQRKFCIISKCMTCRLWMSPRS